MERDIEIKKQKKANLENEVFMKPHIIRSVE